MAIQFTQTVQCDTAAEWASVAAILAATTPQPSNQVWTVTSNKKRAAITTQLVVRTVGGISVLERA